MEEDLGSSSDESRSLPGTDALENIRRLRGAGVGVWEALPNKDWSDGTRLLIDASRTMEKVVWGGVEGTSAKGSMRVSVVGSYPKAAGLKMTGLGGLDGRGDGGVGVLEGGSWNRGAVGGSIGNIWIEAISRVVDGTRGGTRVGRAGRGRGEKRIGGAVFTA